MAEDIRNHPLSIAAIAVAGTLTICIAFISAIVMPLAQKDAEKEIAENKKLRSLYKEYEANKSQTLKLLEEANSKIAELQSLGAFEKNNPYPIGLDRVKLGDGIDKINLTFIAEKKEINEIVDCVSVEIKHPLFRDVTYYYDKKDPNKKIEHIAFFTISEKESSALKQKLTNILGDPKKYKKEGFYSWDINGVTIFKGLDGYSIIKTGEGKPRSFPDE
jgi:hypothetical protein